MGISLSNPFQALSALPQYDVAVIGGGLAGLALAIQCADAGYSVILLEKESYPFHKVCGEYISDESRDFLTQLGLCLDALSLPQINQLEVSDVHGKSYAFCLPLGGFGISRYVLDNSLYEIAKQRGVTVHTNNKVSDVTFENDNFSIKSNHPVEAKVVIGSFGKRSNIDVKWKRPFTQQKPNALNNYVGVKYHIRSPHKDNTIYLHNFRNGYCGMSRIEDGKSCLCYLTTAANLRRCNNSIKEMEQTILHRNPLLKHVFENATFLFEEPVVISQISFAAKSQVEEHVLLSGDAAGMITPLCGNGMSMALHASKLAFTAISNFLSKKIHRDQMEQDYTSNWRKHFASRLRTGRIVQSMFGGNLTTSVFLKTMSILPPVARRLINATHGQPF